MTSSPAPVSPLVAFYDRLVGHDWKFDFSDDHTVWSKGQAEDDALRRQADIAPEFKALWAAYRVYALGPEGTVRPPRPADNAPVTLPPPRPPASALEGLSEADKASVLAAADPQARLAQIETRLQVDARVPLALALAHLGAQPDARNPARWTLPDGAVALAKVGTQAWIEQVTFRHGQGATALVGRILNLDEGQALAHLRAAPWAGLTAAPAVTPVAPAVGAPSEPAPSVPPARVVRRFGSRPS